MKKMNFALSVFLFFPGIAFAHRFEYTVVNNSKRDIHFSLSTRCMSNSSFYDVIIRPHESISEILGTEGSAFGECGYINSTVDISIDNTSNSAHNYHFSEFKDWDLMEVRNDFPQGIISASERFSIGSKYDQSVNFVINQ